MKFETSLWSAIQELILVVVYTECYESSRSKNKAFIQPSYCVAYHYFLVENHDADLDDINLVSDRNLPVL